MAYGIAGVLVVLAALAFAGVVGAIIGWPFLLGGWVAVHEFGAGDPSTARTLTGWAFEGLWVVAFVVIAVRAPQHRIHAWVARTRHLDPADPQVERSTQAVGTVFTVLGSATLVLAVAGLTAWIGEVIGPETACGGVQAAHRTCSGDSTTVGPWLTVLALIGYGLLVRWWRALPQAEPNPRPAGRSDGTDTTTTLTPPWKWSPGAILIAIWMTVVLLGCGIILIVATSRPGGL
ncbi:hypothetical protein ACFXO9_30565 [Nocardia tengchongensis]|uniref:hypothetical protein n=1 Tax=Nocardia tengchongensis TaxID=2055889 RepID=UPI00368EF172